MRNLKRRGGAVVLACSLAATLATAQPASAATPVPVAATVTLGQVCTALDNYIAFLEARPAGPLRDFLLARARLLFDRICH